MDELPINEDDMGKIEVGETSELEETLTWLGDNTDMTLAVTDTLVMILMMLYPRQC